MGFIKFVGLDAMQTDFCFLWVVCGLAALGLGLCGFLYAIRYLSARIYNWNGKRYCYIGRVRLRRSGGGYRVCIGERMADLSYTTRYQICPSKPFIRRNRYKAMMLCAGKARRLVHVDECMRQSVYYREKSGGYDGYIQPVYDCEK